MSDNIFNNRPDMESIEKEIDIFQRPSANNSILMKNYIYELENYIKENNILNNNPHPTQTTDQYWLYAKRDNKYPYPNNTQNSGKWLIFVPIHELDTVWEKIKIATIDGNLGGTSKTATLKPNPNATDDYTKVICVYTYDWTDEEDVIRVREYLRQLGIINKITYKSDNDTYLGKYSKRGSNNISKYFM